MNADVSGAASQTEVTTINAVAVADANHDADVKANTNESYETVESASLEVASAVARLTDAPALSPRLTPPITPAPSPVPGTSYLTTATNERVEDKVPSVAASVLGQPTPAPSPQTIDFTAETC
jgi:hypothetical protein